MINNFSVDWLGLYINLANTIYHSYQTPNFESTYKEPPFIRLALFSDIVLVSNYHGCKGEAINLLCMMILFTKL